MQLLEKEICVKKRKKNNTKQETKTISLVNRKKYKVKEIPKETKKQLRQVVSEITDELLDLVINLIGKNISEIKREKIKKNTENMLQTQFEKSLIASSNISLQIREKSLKTENFNNLSSKEKFYLITDIFYKSSKIIKIPKNVHAMDHFFQIHEDLLNDFLYEIDDLKDPNFSQYLRDIIKLIEKLKTTDNLSKAFTILEKFVHSDTFYLTAQTALQKLIKYYNFIEKEVKVVTKKEVDKYLETYFEFAGIYEKILPVISSLIWLTKINTSSKKKRKQSLYDNLNYVRKSGYKALVSGFDRNIRNSLAHRSFKIKIIEEKVEFIDQKKILSLSFIEVQRRTRNLGSFLLTLPSLFIGIYCSSFLELKKKIENRNT